MKAVVWIVVLFAAAVGIVLTSGIYTGNVYIVVGQVMMRVNLHAFILGLVLFVVTLYFLIKFIVGLMNIPAPYASVSVRRAKAVRQPSL